MRDITANEEDAETFVRYLCFYFLMQLTLIQIVGRRRRSLFTYTDANRDRLS